MVGQSRTEAFSAWFAQVGEARPFLKWAGGKQPFLFRHQALLPTRFDGRYLEPFLGSGAVFFHVARSQVRPFRAYLGDLNKSLIRTFIGVRDNPLDVAAELEIHAAAFRAAKDKSRYYYMVREQFNAELPNVSPGTFIFINKTCWNGLYRVNLKGKFNVPFGTTRTELSLPTPRELEAASTALASASLRVTGWENTLALAQPGDFVFLDPPYYSDLVRGQGPKYATTHFALREYENLARRLADLQERQVDFLLTNSAEPEMVTLFSDFGLSVLTVEVPRVISSKIEERKPVMELVVRPRLVPPRGRPTY